MPLLDRNAEIESGLRNKPVLVPGGSSGIGLAMAQQVVAQGAEVFIASSNAQRVQQAVTCAGGSTVGHTLDLTDEEASRCSFESWGTIVAGVNPARRAGSGMAAGFSFAGR